MQYLEIHSQEEGVETFGAETRYDFYCLKNSMSTNKTTIKGQDGSVTKINISKMEFIPNGMFGLVQKLMAKEGEEKVEILYDRTIYGTDKTNMSKELIEEFKFPCTYTVMKEVTKFWYSNTNEKGHFGIPKLIWGNGRIKSVGSQIDKNGEYGLTQFTYAIVDDANVLDEIQQAFDSKKFRDLMQICSVSDMSINRKAIATFRKDFWKEFLY